MDISKSVQRRYFATRIALYVYILLGLIASSSCNIIIQQSLNATPVVYESVPISWGSNPLTFNSVSGFLVLYNQTDAWFEKYEALYPDSDPKIIIVATYPGYERPYVDERIVQWQRKYRPAAAIFFGESVSEGKYQQVGELDQIKLGHDTSESKYPIVQAWWRDWAVLRPLLLNNTIINATVTDEGVNAWKAIRSGAWFPIWISICILWCLINIGLAFKTLLSYPCIKILPTVVLWIEIISNLLRIPFLLDPFGVWWIPIPLIHVFFSMSWPLHVSSCIIVVFFWWELAVRTKLNIKSGFLTSGKYPAVASIVIMCLVEYSTAAMRAAGLYSAFLSLNAAVYVIVLIALTIIYFYVFTLVFRFIRRSPVLRTREAVLKAVSFRFLMTAISFIFMMIFGFMTLTSYFLEAVGQSVIHFLIYAVLCAGSTCTLSAFAFKPGMKSKNGSSVAVSNTQSRPATEMESLSLSSDAAPATPASQRAD
eukprot:TRINITY_DN13530_c0_g1_i1.p1 TRINITY_DN13530_c0_g1~~TRINITY_DN13530_c0_g1_i1.p1  ORF type:complete len:481 (+),score=34.81 TRINITY_DN13530_c0_g1_i1:114-1556(+)